MHILKSCCFVKNTHSTVLFTARRTAFDVLALAFMTHWSKISFSRSESFLNIPSKWLLFFSRSVTFASFIWQSSSRCCTRRSCALNFCSSEVLRTASSVWQALSSALFAVSPLSAPQEEKQRGSGNPLSLFNLRYNQGAEEHRRARCVKMQYLP